MNSRTLWIAALLAGVLGAAPPVLRAADESPIKGLYVGLRIAGKFEGTLPVVVKEPRLGGADEVKKYAHLVPAGWSWDFHQNYARLTKPGAPPCRTFLLVLPETQAPALKSVIRSAAPEAMRDPGLQKALTGMALVVTGLQTADLTSLFPVPFEQAVPVADTMAIQAFTTAQGALSATSSWKIDGIAPAMMRGMVEAAYADPSDAGTWVLKALPYSGQIKPLQDYAKSFAASSYYSAGALTARSPAERASLGLSAWARPADDYDKIITTALVGQLASSDLKTTPLWLGKLASVPLDVTQNCSPAIFHGIVGAHGIGTGDGGVLIGDAPARMIQSQLSPLASTSLVQLKAALVRQQLRGWRLQKLLTQQGATDDWVQTLLRLNDPLWSFLVEMTVKALVNPSGAATGTATFDVVDSSSQLAALTASWARARTATAALAASKTSKWGSRGDDFFPCRDALDHALCALLVEVIGAGGLRSASTVKPGSALEGRKLTDGVVALLAQGFTRDYVIPATLAQELPATIASPNSLAISLEPDLVWLQRALKAAPTPNTFGVLAHPFGTLDGTRAEQVLTAVVAPPGGRGISSITFGDPSPQTPDPVAALDPNARLVMLATDSLPMFKGAVESPLARYQKRALLSQRVFYSFNISGPRGSDVWVNNWHTKNPTATNADLATLEYYSSWYRLQEAEKALAAALPATTNATTPSTIGAVAFTISSDPAIVTTSALSATQYAPTVSVTQMFTPLLPDDPVSAALFNYVEAGRNLIVTCAARDDDGNPLAADAAAAEQKRVYTRYVGDSILKRAVPLTSLRRAFWNELMGSTQSGIANSSETPDDIRKRFRGLLINIGKAARVRVAVTYTSGSPETETLYAP